MLEVTARDAREALGRHTTYFLGSALTEGPQHCLGRAIGTVFLVLLRGTDNVKRTAYFLVVLSALCYLGVMIVQLVPATYAHGAEFHGFWERMANHSSANVTLTERIPEVTEGLLDGCHGATMLLLLVFLHRWPKLWAGRAPEGSESRMSQCKEKVPDPRTMHVRRLWLLLAGLWVMHISLDYYCQRDVRYATVLIVCSLGFDLAANTFIWALWHEKILFKVRLKGLQHDWARRRDLQDYDYDGYRDDYVQCSEDLEPLSVQWACMLGIFVILHGLEVVLRVVQLFFMISLKFDLVIRDYLLVCGQLFAYTGRLFIALFWSVNMNIQADELHSYILCFLSPGGNPAVLDMPLLVQLVKDCPISFRVLGIRTSKAEVLSLFVAVIGGVASGLLGNLLGG